jgi:hypothetical protein
MDSGHDSSTTESGINTSNLTITNAAGQAATGKSVEQIKAEVATDTVTDTVALNSGHIANNYDAQAVQDEINLQVKVTQEFDKTRQGVKAEINEKEKAARDAAEQETDPVKKHELEQKANRLQNQGILLDIVAGGLAAPTNAVGGIVAGSLAPAVSYQIGQHFKENGTEGSFNHILAHTILGAAVAAAGGNDALIGGLAAGSAEAAAPAVMHYLYGKDIQVKDLTAEQKTTISAIVGLGGAAIGATGGAGDVTQGSMAAVNAVENNENMQRTQANDPSEFHPYSTDEQNRQVMMGVKKVLTQGLNATPILGTVKGLVEYYTGKDALTGDDVSKLEAGLNAGLSLTGPALKGLTTAVLSIRAARLAGDAVAVEKAIAKAEQLAANAQRGKAFECGALCAYGVTKNTSKITTVTNRGELVTIIPDAVNKRTLIEIKDVVYISDTAQFRAYAATQQKIVLIVSPRTEKISSTIVNMVKKSFGEIKVFNPATGQFSTW